MAAENEGQTVKVKVSFTDDADNLEYADQRGYGGGWRPPSRSAKPTWPVPRRRSPTTP